MLKGRETKIYIVGWRWKVEHIAEMMRAERGDSSDEIYTLRGYPVEDTIEDTNRMKAKVFWRIA